MTPSAAAAPADRNRRAMRRALLPLLLLLPSLVHPAPAPVTALDETRLVLETGNHAAALERARALTRTYPQSGEAWRLLGRVLTETGGYEDALAAYRRVLALADGPDLPAEVAAADLEALLGRTAPARERWRRVVAVAGSAGEPLPPAAQIAAGDAYRRLARDDPALYHAALERYEAAVRIAPDQPRAHVAMGDLLLDRYNNTEALEAFRAALELDDGHPPALYGLARSQRFDHSPAAARTARLCLERQPSYLPARLLLARLLLDSEQYAEAERHVREALAVNPRSPEALAVMATIHYLRDREEPFEARVREIRRVAPGYSGLWETLAEIAARNRRYRDALRFAMRQVSLDPQSWRGHALVGENRLRLGSMESGREALEEAFRGDPYDVRTKNTLDLLDRLQGFETRHSDRFDLVAAPGEADVLAPRLLPVAERAYDHFVRRYGGRASEPIRIEVYPRHEDFSVRTVGLVGIDIVGVSFGPVIALDSPSAGAFGPFNWASAVWHEIAHSFHLELSDSRVPRWFTEGLAVYEERQARPGWGMDVSPGFLRAFREGRLAPASDMNRAFLRPSYPDQVPHTYYQASLVMELIEQRRGFGAILEMLRGYADGRTTSELITTVLELSLPAFDAAFEDFVHRRFARSLEGLFGTGDSAAGNAGSPYPELLDRGRRALRDGDLDTAQAALQRALDVFPDHGGPGSPYRLLARVHELRGAPRAAIDMLERSIAIDAGDLQGHLELARLYGEATDRRGAARTLERALLIQPFDPALHDRLAELREDQGRWADAAAARTAVVALDPGDEAGARYRLARSLSRAGKPQEARRELLRALETAPMYEEALELLLTLRRQLGAEDQARGGHPDRAPGDR